MKMLSEQTEPGGGRQITGPRSTPAATVDCPPVCACHLPPATHHLPPSPPARRKPARSAGFTLVELLVVMVIGAILVAILGAAFLEARQHAKRARAETQLHELMKAWTEYYVQYGKWPPGYEGTEKTMSYSTLSPLFASDTVNNTNAIPFINVTLQPPDQEYDDPWGHPYMIRFGAALTPTYENALRISVGFPNRDRYRQ